MYDPRQHEAALDRRRQQRRRKARRDNRRAEDRRSRWATGAIVLLLSLLVGLGLTALAVWTALAVGASYVLEVTADLPSAERIEDRPISRTTEVYDRDGVLLYEIFDPEQGKRTLVPLHEISPLLINATLATEDPDFYRTPGVDPRGILRAAVQNLLEGEIVSGGSGIAQQLIRNVLLDPRERYEISLNRKIREAALAYELTQRYSKDEILEMYLNEIYYGNLSNGVEAAARTYFGKSSRDLTLPEAAMLAGLPQSPVAYDPFKYPLAAKARQSHVLDLMVRHGFLTREEAEAAKLERLQFASPGGRALADGERLRAPHFVMYIRELLEERYGARTLYEHGLRVYTTLDARLQDIAETAVREHMTALAEQNARDAALVAINPATGDILAMVGSPDFYNAEIHGQVNAALAERQPGSAIAPLVYATAFMYGWGPATVVLDEPMRLPSTPGEPPYEPKNFDGRFRGPVTLRYALANSLTIPAIKALRYAGLGHTLALAKVLGLTNLLDERYYGYSFAAGGVDVRLLDLTAAYGVFASGGIKAEIGAISRIEDAEGHVLYQREPYRERVLDPRVAFLISDVLADEEARRDTFGAHSPLALSRPAAAKSGTTDDFRDSWTIGYTPDLVAGVWVGNADNSPMNQVLGVSGAGKIWHSFMEAALAGRPARGFEPPPGLERHEVCVRTGFLADGRCAPTVTDWFVAGTRPPPDTVNGRRYAIDTVSGKLATAFCPLDTVVFQTFEVTVSGDGEQPPTEYCDIHTEPAPQAWEIGPTDTPTPTLSPTPSPTATPTVPTATPTPSATASATATPSSTATASPTATPSRTASPSRTPTPRRSPTARAATASTTLGPAPTPTPAARATSATEPEPAVVPRATATVAAVPGRGTPPTPTVRSQPVGDALPRASATPTPEAEADEIGDLATPTAIPPPTPPPRRAADARVAEAAITSPANGTTVRGTVTIQGRAALADFQFYKVEWGVGSRPREWRAVAASVYRPVEEGPLAAWDTTGLPDGVYSLLLTVVDTAGNAREARVRVIVANR